MDHLDRVMAELDSRIRLARHLMEDERHAEERAKLSSYIDGICVAYREIRLEKERIRDVLSAKA